jgi:hypothetical protein
MNEVLVGASEGDGGSHFEAAVGANVGLDVDKGTIVFEPFESMSRVSVHLVVAVRGAAIWEENHDLMDRLWILGKIVLQKNE